MTSEICVETHVVTSHPLEARSDVDDVTEQNNDVMKGLTERLVDDVYIRDQEDIRKEIETLKGRENDFLKPDRTGVVGEDVFPCDILDQVAEDQDGGQDTAPVELRRKHGSGGTHRSAPIKIHGQSDVTSTHSPGQLSTPIRTSQMSSSTHSQVSIDCDRLSVQFTNSGDFSPDADVTDSLPQTLESFPPFCEKTRRRALRHRSRSLDDDIVVIETDSSAVAKTHLENFSKSLLLVLFCCLAFCFCLMLCVFCQFGVQDFVFQAPGSSPDNRLATGVKQRVSRVCHHSDSCCASRSPPPLRNALCYQSNRVSYKQTRQYRWVLFFSDNG